MERQRQTRGDASLLLLARTARQIPQQQTRRVNIEIIRWSASTRSAGVESVAFGVASLAMGNLHHDDAGDAQTPGTPANERKVPVD
jgi:hypothetical protein